MKAISLHQPYASLIAEGIKTIETRSWKPPDNLIGERIAIHAAKRKMDPLELSGQIWNAMKEIGLNGRERCPLGEIVATAILQQALEVRFNYPAILGGGREVTCWDELGNDWGFSVDPYGDFSVGRWLWILKDIEKIDPPIPAQGHQRFWNWTPSIQIR